jgi:DNA-nicking Smr family endonuclease
MDGDDQDAFREAMRDVKPLDTDPRTPFGPIRKPVAATARRPGNSMADQLAAMDGGEVDTGEELLFRRPGISERIFKRLRRGVFSIQDELDLHGLTVAEARKVLRDFISECAGHNRGCVRVVHGKGLGSGRRGPVLKAQVNRWLRQWDEVLAFATARTRDGGSGAVYVLIRRR